MSAMGTIARRDLAAHKVRLGLTLISVLLGTAFVAGSFVFTDTLKSSFDTIFATGDAAVDTHVAARHDYDPGVPLADVRRIEHVPGAARVEPQIEAPTVLVKADGTKVDSNGAPITAGLWATTTVGPAPGFVSGHAPRAADQVVINRDASTAHGITTGDRIKVVVPDGAPVAVTVSGVYSTPTDTGGYTAVLFQPATAIRLFTDGAHVTTVDVAAAAGVSEQTLTERIRQALPSGLDVQTGTAYRASETADFSSALSFVNYLLLGFGVVALLVGTFIIYNTFAMIVAQRQRELALLRAIGADRKQIRRSVVGEATAIGLLGSALGLAGGVGLAEGLHALLDALNLGLPSGGLVLSVRTILVTLLLGTAATVFAAWAPARRAAAIAPVAAMREQFASPDAVALRRRTVAGVVVAVAAAAATVAGATVGSTALSALLTGGGLVAMCAAAFLLAPLLSRWVILPLGRLVGAPFGPAGHLARTNAIRNPRRTAATSFALTVGLVLVAGIAVIGASVKASLAKIVDDTVTADYIVTTQSELPVPQAAADAVSRVPGVGSTTMLHGLEADLDGVHHSGTGVQGPLAPVVAVTLDAGTLDTSGTNLLVSRSVADDQRLTVGQTVRLRGSGEGAGPTVAEHIAGIYADNSLLGPFLAGDAVYRELTPASERSSYVVLVRAAPGTDLAALRTGLDRATNDYYVVTVEDRAGFKGTIAGQVNGLIGLLYGLLGLAIVIAILGIINTLALSVVERRREIGMLRAVGMRRGQVRRTIYLESLLIAVFGAVLGLAIGLGYGSLFSRALHAAGLDRISVPWGQAALFLVLAAVVGVLAALWPGARAARTPPLAAIAE